MQCIAKWTADIVTRWLHSVCVCVCHILPACVCWLIGFGASQTVELLDTVTDRCAAGHWIVSAET